MNLEGDKRLNIQLSLDYPAAATGEARQAGREDIESPSVASEPERPANTSRIMEEVCERANLKEALRQVRSNKGSAGVEKYLASGMIRGVGLVYCRAIRGPASDASSPRPKPRPGPRRKSAFRR